MRSTVITKTRLVWSSVHKAMQEPNRTSVHRTYIFQAFPNPKGKNVSLGLQGFRMFQNTITSWGLEDTTVYYSMLGSYIWMSRWCNMMQCAATPCSMAPVCSCLLYPALPPLWPPFGQLLHRHHKGNQGSRQPQEPKLQHTATYCNQGISKWGKLSCFCYTR